MAIQHPSQMTQGEIRTLLAMIAGTEPTEMYGYTVIIVRKDGALCTITDGCIHDTMHMIGDAIHNLATDDSANGHESE